MNPPEEQLIRDYVNRVSVAARGRLSPDDRRAFVARTRELIEQNTRGAGQVGPMGVARFLNGLGDPAALVARERDRLAAQPQDAAPAPPASAGPRRSRLSRERRPRPARSAWRDRLRPSGGALSGVLVPRPAAPGSDGAEGGAVSTAGPGGAVRGGADHGGAVPGGGAPGGAVSGGAARGGGRPRQVLAGDVVTGPVPTGEEPLPGPPPLPADVRPGPRRLGWPWQGMSGPEADRAGANGRRPQPQAADAAEAPSRPAGPGQPDSVPAGPGAASPDPAGPGATDSQGGVPPLESELDAGHAPRADRAPGADPAPGAGGLPDGDRAPVIGQWAGGAPVTDDQAAAAHSPGSPNGRAAANGYGPAGGVAASDFTAGDVTRSDVPGTASRPAHDGPSDAAPAAEDLAGGSASQVPTAGGPVAEEPGASPADPRPADREPADREPADRGTRGRWIGGTGPGVGSWAGWKSAQPAQSRPSRFRSSLHPPALPWPSLFRFAKPGPPVPDPAAPGPAAPGPAAPHGSEPRPSRSGRPALRPSLPPGALAAAGAAARKAARYAAVRARERPLEAAAVVLIGLGGAVYPPVWLLGAALALASRVWDSRDKWLGLAVPLFVVIVGMGADVSLSGTQSSFTAYFREAWIFGGHLCRIVAVLGAVYLAWRSQQPRRQQSAEPWNKRRFN